MVDASDIHRYYSGGASNTNALQSLGGARSNTEVVGTDLLDDVTGAESAAGDAEYRCVYFRNEHNSGTITSCQLFFNGNTTSPPNILALGLDPAGKNADATTIANEGVAPSGVTFENPTSASPIDVPDLAPNEYIAVWIRRTIGSGQTAVNDVMGAFDLAFDSGA